MSLWGSQLQFYLYTDGLYIHLWALELQSCLVSCLLNTVISWSIGCSPLSCLRTKPLISLPTAINVLYPQPDPFQEMKIPIFSSSRQHFRLWLFPFSHVPSNPSSNCWLHLQDPHTHYEICLLLLSSPAPTLLKKTSSTRTISTESKLVFLLLTLPFCNL